MKDETDAGTGRTPSQASPSSFLLHPSSFPTRIGVLGGGQLGRMLALAGYPLGLRFRFLDPAPEAPVEELAELVAARWDDTAALDGFARGLDAVTYEFENVPADAVGHLMGALPVHP